MFGLVIMNTAVSSPSFDLRSSRSTSPFALLFTVTVSNPASAADAGFVPCAESGTSTLLAVRLPLVAEVRGGDEERGEFALRPGGRLERHRGQARNLREVLLHLEEQFEHALRRVVVLQRVQCGEPRQRREPLVPLGVVLHRARPQRVEVGVDATCSAPTDSCSGGSGRSRRPPATAAARPRGARAESARRAASRAHRTPAAR